MTRIQLHFLKASVGPLRKQLGLIDGDNSYPTAKKMTSIVEEIEVSKEGLTRYAELLRQNAAEGNALLKGHLTKQINNESRRGLTDKEAKTQLLVLDIDALPIEIKQGKVAQGTVKKYAEKVIQTLPEILHDVSYIALASSSFGLKKNVLSIHLHVLLDKPIAHSVLKSWITSLNYTQPEIFDNLSLTPSKMHIKSLIDPCLAEPSRIIYIAPPFFGPRIENPFKDDKKRVVLVHKEHTSLSLQSEISNLSQNIDRADLLKEQKLRALQKQAGIKKVKRKVEKFKANGQDRFVITNPENIIMEMANYDDEFVRYNVGGGDSNAYWVRRDNPEIVYCFKPDEKPFLFAHAAPEAYEAHVKKFGGAYTVESNGKGQNVKVERFMYINQYSDMYTTLELDRKNNTIVDLRERKSAQVASEWMKHFGLIVPDPVPPLYVKFEPNNSKGIYTEGHKLIANTFTPTELMETKAEAPYKGSYGNAWQLCVECPCITEMMFHMLGSDFECYEHFVNWLAYIFQFKDKTRTAWMIQGTNGTGKGLFFKKVVRALFGHQYTKMNTLQRIADDQFNGWMEMALLIMVDEFNMKATSSGLTKTASEIKTLITEPTFMVRKMQQQQREVPNLMNFILGTNDFDALTMRDKRRVSVSPRQEIMLDVRNPVITDRPDDYDALIAEEMKVFAPFLRDFKVDVTQAHKIIHNTARDDAHEAGMSASERFFTDARTGNFDAFADYLDKPESNLNNHDFAELKRVKSILRAILPHVNGKPCFIAKDDLRAIYSLLAGKPINANAFGKMMTKEGIYAKRCPTPIGHAYQPTRPRCVEIQWRYADAKALEEIRKAHTKPELKEMNHPTVQENT